MYAVLKTGGKQYKVVKDDLISIEKLDAEQGQTVVFDKILMLDDSKGKPTFGTPLIVGASVKAEVIEQKKGPKVLSLKKRQRSMYRRLKGHRQFFSIVKILDISASGGSSAATPTPTKAAAPKAVTPKAIEPKTETVAASTPKAAEPKKAEPKKETAAAKKPVATTAKKATATKTATAKKAPAAKTATAKKATAKTATATKKTTTTKKKED